MTKEKILIALYLTSATAVAGFFVNSEVLSIVLGLLLGAIVGVATWIIILSLVEKRQRLRKGGSRMSSDYDKIDADIRPTAIQEYVR